MKDKFKYFYLLFLVNIWWKITDRHKSSSGHTMHLIYRDADNRWTLRVLENTTLEPSFWYDSEDGLSCCHQIKYKYTAEYFYH